MELMLGILVSALNDSSGDDLAWDVISLRHLFCTESKSLFLLDFKQFKENYF